MQAKLKQIIALSADGSQQQEAVARLAREVLAELEGLEAAAMEFPPTRDYLPADIRQEILLCQALAAEHRARESAVEDMLEDAGYDTEALCADCPEYLNMVHHGIGSIEELEEAINRDVIYFHPRQTWLQEHEVRSYV